MLYIFGCARSLLLHGLFPSCGERGLLLLRLQAPHCRCCGFSCRGAQALEHKGFTSGGMWVQWLIYAFYRQSVQMNI